MEELDIILKELRVDWEGICSDDFNPLHLGLRLERDSVLASRFRDMFYRLESAMEKIIAANFKGFSGSIDGYSEFGRANKELIQALQAVIDIAEVAGASSSPTATGTSIQNRVQEIQEGFRGIEAENQKKVSNELKHTICKNLIDVKQMVYEFDTAQDLYKKSDMIIQSLDTLDQAEYLKIKGVDEYRKVIYGKYLSFVGDVNERIGKYIFQNKQENLHYIRCVTRMGSLQELEKFFQEHFRELFRGSIEDTIQRVYQAGHSGIGVLCKAVSHRVESVHRNMQALIKNIVERFEMESKIDFYGRQVMPFKFCADRDFVLGVITAELGAFISRYTQFSKDAYEGFDMGCVVDDLDYSSIYSRAHHITRKLAKVPYSKVSFNEEYTLITAPRMDITIQLLKYTTDAAIRIFLNDLINKEYTRDALASILERMDEIFATDPLVVEPETLKLKLFERIMELFKEHDTPEHRAAIKERLDDRIYSAFQHLFYEFFKNEFLLEMLRDSPVSEEEFNSKIVTRSISKKDLILSAEKYQVIMCVINTLREFDVLLGTRNSSDIYCLYLTAFKRQLRMEFIYFFDLFYRQGCYKLYTRKMMRIPRMVYGVSQDEKYFEGLYDVLNYYIRSNVLSIGAKDREGIIAFLDNLKVLDEMLAPVEPAGSFGSIYHFFERILSNNSDDRGGRALQKRISSN